MRPELSLYLDAVRFAAAMVVFLAHFGLHRLSGGLLWQATAFGNEAVTVFFVLSGFVIAHTCAVRETDARSYVVSRAARLYSVVVPAVIVTAVLDLIGSRLNPAAYTVEWGFVDDYSLYRFLTALTFTNELWTQKIHQGSNGAFWSLGYEVPYYVVFGLAMFTPGRWRWPAVALSLLAIGPSIVSMLPIWLAGVAAYHLSRRNRVSEARGLALFTLSVCGWLAYEVIVARFGRPIIGYHVYFKRFEIVQDYIVAVLFAMNLLGFSAAARPLGHWLMRHASSIRWLAGATFTLYICHTPIAQFLVAIAPWPNQDPRCRILVFVGSLLAVFLLAEVTERRKDSWRRWVDRLLPGRSCARSVRSV